MLGATGVGGVAHMLLAVTLQEKQVWGLVQVIAHGVLAGLLGLLGSVRQRGGRAQAGLADSAAQPGRRGAPGSPWGQGRGSLGTDPLQLPGLGIYP